MTGQRAAEMGFGVDGLDTQDAHQPLDPLSIHLQFHGHAAAAIVGPQHVQFVESPKQS